MLVFKDMQKFAKVGERLKAPDSCVLVSRGDGSIEYVVSVKDKSYRGGVFPQDRHALSYLILSEFTNAYYEMFPEGCPTYLLMSTVK